MSRFSLGLERPLGPVAFPLIAVPVLLSQHALAAAIRVASGAPVQLDAGFLLLPLQTLDDLGLSAVVVGLAFVYSMLVAAALTVLCFRRAVWSKGAHPFATLAFVPVLQWAVVVVMACAPRMRPAPQEAVMTPRHVRMLWGLFVGMGLVVLAVFVSTIVFGVYGWGVFVLMPILVGFTTAYAVNRGEPAPKGGTTVAVLGALALGGAALLVFALEGVVCILMASPLAVAMAAAGAAIGKQIAKHGHNRTRPEVFSAAALPLVLALEALLPPSVTLDTRSSVTIAAPPAAVWRALTQMETITPAPAPPFRLGLAYPTGARIVEARTGGERLGRFSTGLARERITAWAPGKRLAFEVLETPPMMDELSPHGEVHAPHQHGYFETAWTAFDFAPAAGGGTRLTLTAQSRLRLDPVLYWEPVARWAIASNSARVLAHVKASAEGDAPRGPPSSAAPSPTRSAVRAGE